MILPIFIGDNVYSTTAKISGYNNSENIFYQSIINGVLMDNYNIIFTSATALTFITANSILTDGAGFANITATGITMLPLINNSNYYLFVAYFPTTPNYLYFVVGGANVPDGSPRVIRANFIVLFIISDT